VHSSTWWLCYGNEASSCTTTLSSVTFTASVAVYHYILFLPATKLGDCLRAIMGVSHAKLPCHASLLCNISVYSYSVPLLRILRLDIFCLGGDLAAGRWRRTLLFAERVSAVFHLSTMLTFFACWRGGEGKISSAGMENCTALACGGLFITLPGSLPIALWAACAAPYVYVLAAHFMYHAFVVNVFCRVGACQPGISASETTYIGRVAQGHPLLSPWPCIPYSAARHLDAPGGRSVFYPR